MSYSFNLRAASKIEAIAKVVVELDKISISQPPHAHDRSQVEAAARSLIDLMPEPPEGKELYVSMNGSLRWTDDQPVIGVSLGVNVSFMAKE